LLMLPESFTTAYEAVYLRAFGAALAGTQRRDGEAGRVSVRRGVSRVSSAGVDTVGIAGPVTGSGGSRVPVADERALAAKTWADRKLRALARELDARLTGRGHDVPVQRRCAGRCKKFGDADWLYCPWCGGPTEDVVRE
jgi:hypothetical protein